MVESFEVTVMKDPDGNPVPTVTRLSPNQEEMLKRLNDSDSWKFYRTLLLQAKNGYVTALLQENDPTKMAKTVGLVAGLNFALNQLGVLLDQINKKHAKSVESETKNSPQG
jgi:hypothetical protein